MTPSNYPNGFAGGLVVQGLPILNTHSGEVKWVHSAGGSTGAGTFASPFSTLAQALARCVAGRGDVIMVKPGHAETVSAASGIDLDKAGVTIIGLGQGLDRPTFTLDTATTTTIAVSAANICVMNCIFTANFADIVAVFTLTAAKNFRLHGNYIKATATNMNFLNVVDTSTTDQDAAGLALVGNKWIEPDTATLSMVQMDSTNADVEISDNFVQLGVKNNTPALLNIANGKIVTNLQMLRNYVIRLNTDTATGGILLHTNGSTLSGMVADNVAQHADTAAEILITASSGLSVARNFASGVVGASGYLLPAADS